MTLDQIISSARSRAGDKDAAALRYDDETVTTVIDDVRRSLGVKKVANLSMFTVDIDAGTISPEPTDEQGEILATAAALRLLQQTYRERIDTGTMGVSWQSGLEQESTISQEKAYLAMLKDLEAELSSLVILTAVLTSATRPQ